jgi:hypothetical protein
MLDVANCVRDSWSGGGGVARGVKYFRHLAVVDAVGVITKGSVSVLVLKGFSFAFVTSVAPLVRR